MTENNPFKNKASTEAPKQDVAAVAETPKEQTNTQEAQPSGRRVISEETMDDTNWINLPKKTEINVETPILKIAVDGYYQQEGKEYKNSETKEMFYSGLETKAGERVGEFVIEGTVEGQSAKCRLSNWELVYKMNAFVKHCKKNNLTVANQEISFLRINEGSENAGKNWTMKIHSLKKKVVDYDNNIVDM